MNILGVSGAIGDAASAALFVDGQLVAAVEEERFLRENMPGKIPAVRCFANFLTAGLSEL